MIMSFWPTSLRVEENKKKEGSEWVWGRAGREREAGGGGGGGKCRQSRTKGEKTKASLLEKKEKRKGVSECEAEPGERGKRGGGERESVSRAEQKENKQMHPF